MATTTYVLPLVTPAQWATINTIGSASAGTPAVLLSEAGATPPTVTVELWDDQTEQLTTLNIAPDGRLVSHETWSDTRGNEDNLPSVVQPDGLGGSATFAICEPPLAGSLGGSDEPH